MRKKDIKKPGLYKLFWSDDPTDLSVAAVGTDEKGKVWYACTNWISGICFDWKAVHHVELITTQEAERAGFSDRYFDNVARLLRVTSTLLEILKESPHAQSQLSQSNVKAAIKAINEMAPEARELFE